MHLNLKLFVPMFGMELGLLNQELKNSSAKIVLSHAELAIALHILVQNVRANLKMGWSIKLLLCFWHDIIVWV